MVKKKVSESQPDSVVSPPDADTSKDEVIQNLQEQVAMLQTQIGQLATIIQKSDERTAQVAAAVVEKNMAALAESIQKQRAEADAKAQAEAEAARETALAVAQQPVAANGAGNFIQQLMNAAPTFIDAWQKLKPPPTEQQIFRELEMGFKIHRALAAMQTGDISAFESIFTKK